MADVKPFKISAGQLVQFQSGDTVSTTVAPGTYVTATNGQQSGSGTSYTLTVASARVFLGTTQVNITVPAGTYLIYGCIRFTGGGTTNDAFRVKLYDTTTSADIGVETAAPAYVSEDITLPLFQIKAFTNPATEIAIFARNATAARGTIVAGPSWLGYVRLA